ncbi:uncharacterized protein LOC119667570 [Teleopsis dalmanni]|uniref:uncharacterized protein LOC119667570 n=1 Tax=Teleopsis dalmanni TaxID=139649 RepID=UPI0018CE13EF|nr:uncharacterized protein LOC119667570 [Teleopsis dalmanni]
MPLTTNIATDSAQWPPASETLHGTSHQSTSNNAQTTSNQHITQSNPQTDTIQAAIESMNDVHECAWMTAYAEGAEQALASRNLITLPTSNTTVTAITKTTTSTTTTTPQLHTSITNGQTHISELTRPQILTTIAQHYVPDILYPKPIPGGFTNLTTLRVPKEVEILLSFGPQYCPVTPPSLNDYISAIYTYYDAHLEATTDLSVICRQEMENHASKFLDVMVKHRQPTPFHKMLQHLFQQTYNFIHLHDQILTIQADKSKSTILIHKNEYINKVETWLQAYLATGSCKEYKGDIGLLVRKTHAQYIRIFRSLCRVYKGNNNPYPSSIHMLLRSHSYDKPALPYLYGTIKTHKPNNPIRPICSQICWYSQPIQKLCQHILETTTKTRLSNHNLSDINQLTNHILQLKHIHGYVLVTMDICDMYPTTQIASLWSLLEDMTTESWFQTACPIDIEIFQRMLNYILQQWNYFTFNGTVYQQVDGLPQGGSASGILATLYLDTQISLNYNTLFLSHHVHSWWKYVDDVLLYMPQSSVQSFVETFPQLIRYEVTYEIEKINPTAGPYPTIAYLDYNIEHTPTTFQISIHSKPTESQRMLHYTSHTSQSTKRSALSSHIRRI